MDHPLKVARERRSLTQEALEARSGVPQATISRYEKLDREKHPDALNLFYAMSLCRVLGTTVEEVFAPDFDRWRVERARAAAQSDDVAEKGVA